MAKNSIHPEWYPNAKVYCDGQLVMKVGSTQPRLNVDIWSGNHPFFPAPSEDMKGKVIDEVERGYALNGKVIRYAKVIVGN